MQPTAALSRNDAWWKRVRRRELDRAGRQHLRTNRIAGAKRERVALKRRSVTGNAPCGGALRHEGGAGRSERAAVGREWVGGVRQRACGACGSPACVASVEAEQGRAVAH